MSWINNLQIKYKEEPDGSGTIVIEWDENDCSCSLEQWMSWGEEKQKQFIFDALTLAVSDALNDNET